MADPGGAAGRRSTPRAVGGRLQRVQEAIGRLAGRAASAGRKGAGRMQQLMGRFGQANRAAERTISTKGAPAGSLGKRGVKR